MLEHVKAQNAIAAGRAASVELHTTSDEWRLYYGRALGFFFLPTSPAAAAPSDSLLHVMEFNCNLEYDGVAQPTIARVIGPRPVREPGPG